MAIACVHIPQFALRIAILEQPALDGLPLVLTSPSSTHPRVIDCTPDRDSISGAIRTLYSKEFQSRLKSVTNPYGDGGASERIVETLATFPLDGIVKKAFYDLPPTT